MSLPPGFIDELRTRLSLADVVARKVVWDTRKSNAGKGDMWAPCPFHQEKSASFHVVDREGYYYCFGCHAKGDAINFVQETENVSFIEAVEILAREAGMTMPARDPRAREKADLSQQLVEINEAALRFFRLSLQQGIGADARAYLDKRGMRPETRERFEIGYAPNGNALMQHLKGQGMDPVLMQRAGLLGKPDDGRDMYDFFRDRIMFPIRDARGRLISFGGRSMDPNARAKYLNGPATTLFDKSAALYNIGPARAAAGQGQTLIVAEGYMDVIALSEAGFEATVAPLGTAVTEGQLAMMWRLSAEPVMALDGDPAGLRAAYKVIDLSLPLLKSGDALRFALLPDKTDPDELIKSKGREAMQGVVDGALPMVALLWRRETEGKTFDSPERRAALETALAKSTRLIEDQMIRRHYEDALKELRWNLFRPARAPRPARGKWTPRTGAPVVPTAGTKASALAAGDDRTAQVMREAVVLATLLMNPSLIERFLDRLERLDMVSPDHARLLSVILRYEGAAVSQELRESVVAALGREILDLLMARPHVQIAPPVRRPDPVTAAACLDEELTKLRALYGAKTTLDEAIEDMLAAEDEAVTWRLGEVAASRNRAIKAETEETIETDIADNGLEINRSERDRWQKLLNEIHPDKRQ